MAFFTVRRAAGFSSSTRARRAQVLNRRNMSKYPHLKLVAKIEHMHVAKRVLPSDGLLLLRGQCKVGGACSDNPSLDLLLPTPVFLRGNNTRAKPLLISKRNKRREKREREKEHKERKQSYNK
uniref:Uncharacterized protein n=1 Tax=Setaria viridis TaxID=4556 RepID=A0A4U6UTR9_SETVI|nr:hypothetical protein SEVIR_4G046100v2 [Setaria viridis]